MHPVLVSGLSKSLVRLTTIVALCGWAAVGDAASFPCEKARSKVEKVICADPELSQLDWYLGAYYEGARYALQDGADCLKTDQLHWLKAVRNVCADRSCLKAAYLVRLSELDGFQPGASVIKDRELPDGPSLVWVIPPAGDTVAAPPNPRAKPLEARGKLVNEISNGDGFILRTPAGNSYLLVMLMFLDGAGPLDELAKDSQATYLARGYGVTNERGTFFEPSRCTYLYRLP